MLKLFEPQIYRPARMRYLLTFDTPLFSGDKLRIQSIEDMGQNDEYFPGFNESYTGPTD